MPNDESLFIRYFDAETKFNYFTTGLSAAALLYSVQTFDSADYARYVILGPMAWLFLILSLLAGIGRIDYLVYGMSKIAMFTMAHERLSLLKQLSNKINTSIINPKTGNPFTESELADQINETTGYLTVIESRWEKRSKTSYYIYFAHSYFFIQGILLLGILKALNL